MPQTVHSAEYKKFIQHCRQTMIELLVSERTCTEAQKTCKTFRAVDLQLEGTLNSLVSSSYSFRMGMLCVTRLLYYSKLIIYSHCAMSFITQVRYWMTNWEVEDDLLKGSHKERHRKDWLQLKE